MKEVLKNSFSVNLPRVLISVLLCMILKTSSLLFTSSPVLSAKSLADGVFSPDLLFALPLFFFSLVIVNVIDFGLIHYLTDFILKKQSALRSLFYGFTLPVVWKASVFFALIEALSFAFMTVSSFLFSKNVAAFFLNAEIAPADMLPFFVSVFFSLIYVVVSLVLKLPFIFTWYIICDDKGVKIFESFSRSFKLLMPRFFHFAGFVIYSSFKNFILYAVFFCAETFYNSGTAVLVFSFFSIVQFLLVMTKVYSSRPVYYYSLLSVNGLIGEQVNAEAKEGTDESSS